MIEERQEGVRDPGGGWAVGHGPISIFNEKEAQRDPGVFTGRKELAAPFHSLLKARVLFTLLNKSVHFVI